MKLTVEIEQSLTGVLRQLGAKKRMTPETLASSLLSAALRTELKRRPGLASESRVKALVDAAQRRRAHKATRSI